MTEQNKDTATKPSEQNSEDTNNEEQKKPKGLLRTPGLAALLVTVGGLGAGGYFFADSIAKFAIKQSLEVSIGAQTDIESVTVSWVPFGVTVNKLAQTDPASPANNLFSFNSFAAQIHPWEFLLGKYVIDNAQISDLQFGAKRQGVGEVFSAKVNIDNSPSVSNKSEGAGISSDGLAIPSADELLAKLDLQTQVKAKAFEQVWKQEKQQIEQVFANLPDDKTLKSLKGDWKRLKSSDIKSLDDIKKLKKELKQVKQKIDKNKDAIKLAKGQYKTSKSKINIAYKELEQATKDDWKKVEAQIPLNDPNAVAISKMLFGDEIAGYVQTGQEYWQKAQPYIAEHKANKEAEALKKQEADTGSNITFVLEKNWPDWIVNNLEVSITSQQQSYQLLAKEVNIQSYVRNLPSTYQVKLADNFELNGQYFVDKQSQFSTEGDWLVTKMPVPEKSLSNSSDLSLNMQQAVLNGNGRYNYQQSLQAIGNLTFEQTQFVGNASTKLAKLTLDTLSGVKQFDLNLEVKGQPTSPDIDISSNLDSQLNKAFKNAFNNQWSQVKQEAKTKL